MQVYLAAMSINALAVVNSGMDSISVITRRLTAVESSCKHRLMTNRRPQHPMLPFLAKKLVSILFVCYSKVHQMTLRSLPILICSRLLLQLM